MRSSPEFDLIAAIRDRLGERRPADVRIGIGDDAAVTVAPAARPGGQRRCDRRRGRVPAQWCPPRAIGRKAPARRSATSPRWAPSPPRLYVWVGIPEDLGRDERARALRRPRRAGRADRGDDPRRRHLTASPVLAVAVTAIGVARPAERMVGRAGAQPGDAICVTGAFGGAAAGLMLLEHPELAADVAEAAAAAVRERQLDAVAADRRRAGARRRRRHGDDRRIATGSGPRPSTSPRPPARASRSRSTGSGRRRGSPRSPPPPDAIRSSSSSPAARTTNCSARSRARSSPTAPQRWRRRESS